MAASGSFRVKGFSADFVAPALYALLLAAAAGLLLTGAMRMLRLRSYPMALTAAILALVPWSLGWLLGLPFGIWALVVLRRGEVMAAFLGKQRGAGVPEARVPVAGKMRSLFRSFGRYFLTTAAGRQSLSPPPPAMLDAGPPGISLPPGETLDYRAGPRVGGPDGRGFGTGEK